MENTLVTFANGKYAINAIAVSTLLRMGVSKKQIMSMIMAGIKVLESKTGVKFGK